MKVSTIRSVAESLYIIIIIIIIVLIITRIKLSLIKLTINMFLNVLIADILFVL